MNDRKFDVFQHAADQTMLEEAQRPMKKNHIRARAAAAAACICIVAAAVILQPWNSSKTGDPPGNGGNVQIANPWSDTTLAQIRAMGYALTLPDGAENAAFTALNANETGAEMVQASYTLDGTAYTCRAAKASDPEDISGLYETWDQDLSWTVGEAQLQLCTNNLTGYVSWFLPDEGQQWCVSSSGSDAELLENARILAAGLGQELATAPEGAEDVVISVFSQDGRTVAETAFTLSGARWVYRTAPGELELVDISGLSSFSLSAAGKVSYCDAQLSYDEGGAGKIIWFDIVPGIEYSLSVDTGASAEENLRLCGYDEARAAGQYYTSDMSGKALNNLDFVGIASDSDVGHWDIYTAEPRDSQKGEMIAMNGGFFFLGIFLGVLFIMATVLIIYYKQVSEGYEDRARFQIMQQVGLQKSEIRRSVNHQLLIVFFAPLLVAAVHVAFDFRLIRMLLTLFQQYDAVRTMWCTLGTLGVFAALYLIVYRVTARAYYKIVE